MGAVLKLPDNIISFQIPKRRPRIREKEDIPHVKSYSIAPYRAVTDKRLHEMPLRVLMLICSYTNRAGITWVGQQTLATQLGITKQTVGKHMKLLKELGYLEVVSKGFRGERANTTRVIFDEKVTTEDAISLVSAQEDARPPYMIRQEEREMDEAKRKALVEQATKLSEGFGKVNVFKVDTEPRETDSITVREMRVKIAEHKEKVKRVAKVKREKLSKDADELMEKVNQLVEKKVVKPVDNSSHSSVHSSSHSNSPESYQRELEGNNKVIYKDLSNKLINVFINKVKVINKLERVVTVEDREVMLSLVEKGLTEEMWIAVLDDTLQTMASKRQDPPHRISWFKSGLDKVLDASLA